MTRLLLSTCLVACLLAASAHADEQAPDLATGTLYLFASASIPASSLHTLARDAGATRTPMILRGLIGHSLQETLMHMKPVTDLGAALEIDPLLYEAYGVAVVPAVVLTCGGRGQGPFAIVYGLSPSAARPILHKQLTC